MTITAAQIEAMQDGETINLPDSTLCVERHIVRSTMKNGRPVWHHYFKANPKALKGCTGGFDSRSVAQVLKDINRHQGR